MRQIYNDNIKRPKSQATWDLKNLRILPENSIEGLGSKREHCWSYVVSTFENTTKILLVQGRVQLEHSSHTGKVDVEAK